LHILVINSGSSSIKFSIFASGSAHWPDLLYNGEIGGIGANQTFRFSDAKGAPPGNAPKDASAEPVELLESAVCGPGMPAIDAVGYRVVHPGPLLDRHQLIDEEVLKDLEQAVSFAPLHDPAAIALIREMMQRFPRARHYACFDTIFHHTMPPEASAYAIPQHYRQQGVRRYGFHGLSCESIVDELRVASHQGEAQFPARMVIAHLGSGCSVTAVVDGKSVDTSMGLTPTGGVVMGTRPGDLDPGLVLYLLRQAEGDRDAALKAVEALLNHKAGMVSLSNLPNDMRITRKAAAEGNTDAVLALKVFTRSVRKAIGSYAWLLGGLDALVFTGGIGEHDALSRAEILEGLETCGVTLDRAANQASSEKRRRISALYAPVTVWVITAQEDRMIAMHVSQMQTKEEV
jgi:acetate kinase